MKGTASHVRLATAQCDSDDKPLAQCCCCCRCCWRRNTAAARASTPAAAPDTATAAAVAAAVDDCRPAVSRGLQACSPLLPSLQQLSLLLLPSLPLLLLFLLLLLSRWRWGALFVCIHIGIAGKGTFPTTNPTNKTTLSTEVPLTRIEFHRKPQHNAAFFTKYPILPFPNCPVFP